VDAQADAASREATNREKRRPSTDFLEGFFMPEATQIQPEKVQAYLATGYRLGISGHDVMLRIGQHSDRLASLFAGYKVNCGAFLTAFNPHGIRQADVRNERAHDQLAELLDALAVHVIEGTGCSEESDWPAEPGFFALGLTLEQARVIGSRFDQDAFVWVGSDVVPQLILLR